MKKLIITLAFIPLIACNDFLNEPLKGGFNSNNIFSNEQQVQLAITGVYNSANIYTNLWKFGDVASDDAVKGGNDGDQSDVNDLNNFSANRDNGSINVFWQQLYESVARANNVITNIVPLEMNASLKNRYIAEAKFFRALAYFNLVNIFGEVPLKLLPQTTPAAIHVPLFSVAAIYAQIEDDLSKAAPNLEITYPETDKGRVTRGAAYALLAKAQLYQAKYNEALISIKAVEDLAIYDLEPVYADLFKLGSENSVETIFAIRFQSNENPGIGNILNQYFAPYTESGYFMNAPTQSFVDVFTEKQVDGKTDQRLDASIGRDGMPWLNGDVFDKSWSLATGYLVKKHNQPLSEVTVGKKGDGGLPYIYLRYADLLLMKAEALNETAHPDLAEVPLNKVRNRAALSALSGKNQSQLRDIIRNERRKELGFEFHRFFDIMRWGQSYAESVLGENFKWVSPRFYFPIPQAEIDGNQAI